MELGELTEDIVLMLPVILLAESVVALIIWFAWGSKGGRGARFAAWLGLCTLTLWVGSALAFVALHLLLFSFGNGAVIAGVIATTLFMLLMPFGWWYLISRRSDAGRQPDAGQPR